MKIIFIDGLVETLSYFSRRMSLYFEKNGYEVWFWDMHKPLASREQFESMSDRQDMLLVTFNFIGLSGESQFEYDNEISIWDAYGISRVCIMVDHPMYYENRLRGNLQHCRLLCVDRDHCKYIEEYFPPLKASFLPLGGTKLAEKEELNDRKIDVLFAGNYVTLEGLLKHIENLEPDMKEYLIKLANVLIAHPDMTMEAVAKKCLVEDFDDVTTGEIKEFMHNMIFVDLYVRSYFRRKIICELAQSGIKIHVIGKDWDKAGCGRPENIVCLGVMDSLGCLKTMQRAKISLNIMPWFKNGAHDRIYNSLLQACITVTDSSGYLDENEIEKYAVIYDLEHTATLADRIKEILDNPESYRDMVDRGYEYAEKNTWEERAGYLIECLKL